MAGLLRFESLICYPKIAFPINKMLSRLGQMSLVLGQIHLNYCKKRASPKKGDTLLKCSGYISPKSGYGLLLFDHFYCCFTIQF